ncbi:hypothetical protein Tsubulata_029171 [Turnera subulata]|uniref:DUF4283 domain-containing protein n=1 Tax=Turnera subulata TaxID=218843 RepID=A0A9Q0J168_9ROSI|nr:hypothetical protein Tsubulata_029171 [Turnera subulata]
MAVGDPPLLDSTGTSCDKSSLVLDLSSLDRLMASTSRSLKGKSVGAVTLTSRVSDLGTAPTPNLPSDSDKFKTGSPLPRQSLDFIPSALGADSEIQKMDISSSVLLVWVQFNNVPLELSTREGLSYLASAIGKPLHMDQDCSKILKSDCINFCIDVDFAKPLLPKLLVNLDGELCSISVTYSWQPLQCALCNRWGHHQLACPSKKIQHVSKWVPKLPISKGVTVIHPAVPASPPLVTKPLTVATNSLPDQTQFFRTRRP